MTRKQEYAKYLQSAHWLDLRGRCLAAAGGKCALCGRPRFLQAHHVIYRSNFFETRISDLLALCVYCHAKHHGKTADIPDGWLKKERQLFVDSQPKPVPKKKPKWVERMLAKAAGNREKRLNQQRTRNDYRLRVFRERMRVTMNG